MRRPPPNELAAFWAATTEIYPPTLGAAEPTDLGVAQAWRFLRSKHIEPAHLAGMGLARLAALRGPDLSWWPAKWRQSYRLVTRAFDARGTFASIHARAITQTEPKTLWPRGCEARGLMFACPSAQALLQGDLGVAAALDGILIAEGLTDFLAGALWVASERLKLGRIATLGITQGSVAAFVDVEWPRGAPVYVATDPDQVGDSYAAAVRAAVPADVSVRRFSFRRQEAHR